MSAKTTEQPVFSASIDFDKPGKQFGHIQIPFSRDDAAMGSLMIPIVSIRGGKGPCLLLNAGSHGDEFEGQIALRNLAHELKPEAVSGQVILIPSLNLPAVLNNSRCSPLDDANMNRIFPGDAHGTISRKIAAYVYRTLIPRVDFVVDLHAGGRNYKCLCYPMMHRYPNAATTRATFGLLKAFQAPYGVVFDTEPDRDGMLDTAVEDLDKPFIAVELGGCGMVTPASIAIATRGVRNVLVHCGLTEGQIEPGEVQTQVLGVPAGGFVAAEDHGIFEPLVDLGHEVRPEQAIGRLHSIHRPDRVPIVHRVEAGGRVLIRRTTGTTTHGDTLIVVAVPIEPGF